MASVSIRRRLLLILIPSALALWVLSAVISYLDTRNEVEDMLDTQLALSGRVLLAMSLHEIVEQRLLGGGTDEPAMETIPPSFWKSSRDYEKQLAFQIWVNKNILAMRSENAPLSFMSKQFDGFSDEIIAGVEWRVFGVQTEGGLIRVQIAEQYSVRHELANAMVMRITLPLIITLPILAWALWYGVGQGMNPLRRIAHEVQSRRPSELRPINDDYIPAEARPLTDALNQLFGRLKAAFDLERRFTSDAAHELRTPMAALKTHAEVALAAKTEEESKKALRQVIRGVDRSTRLVEQLLTLARLDPESGVAKARRFDVFIIAETVISDEALEALDKNIEISLNGTRGKFIWGDADAIGVMIRNLVDNAIRYTPENGEVEINIERHENTIKLDIEDSGPGIPESEREKVFKRFYRQLGTKTPGSGLGLSIVTRIADLHKIDLMLGTSKLGGLKVSVFCASADID